MEINKLKTFADLAQTLNFSETAANLYITQSSVSKHIKSLEKEIGQPLFIRNNKHVVLSAYGQTILPYVKQILTSNEQMQAALKQIEEQRRKTIVLGTIPTFSNYVVFQQIANFGKQDPNLQIILKECETVDIYDQLLAGKIDLAFVRKIDKLPAAFDTIKLKEESFKLYLPEDDPLTKQKTVKVSELKDRNFITLDKDSLLQEPVLKLCHKAGFEAHVTFVSDRVSSIMEMVKNGQGVAIMMDSLPRVKGVAVRDISPTLTGELLFIKKKTLNFASLTNFWHYLKSIIPNENNL